MSYSSNVSLHQASFGESCRTGAHGLGGGSQEREVAACEEVEWVDGDAVSADVRAVGHVAKWLGRCCIAHLV